MTVQDKKCQRGETFYEVNMENKMRVRNEVDN